MPDTPNTVRSGPERDEAEGYRPLSALAVLALALAGLTTATVLGIWITAKIRGRPILIWEVLLVAAVGLGLAVAAKSQLNKSDSTRAGLGLAKAALWLSLFCLGGYGAYFAATGIAVRQQARDVADKMFALLVEGKPELAFRLTRPPAQQRGIEPDPEKIRNRFGSTDLFHFMGTELVRTFRTWPDKARVQFVGERGREDQPDGFTLHLEYTIRTPEGEFDAGVATRGVDDPATGGRDWQVVWNQTGVRTERRLTKLGRLCSELQIECARRFLRLRWLPELSQRSVAELNGMLRVEGNVPPEGQREQLAQDVKRPNAINLFPGSSPTRGPGLPLMLFSPDGVRLSLVVEVNAPSVDKTDSKVPAWLTVRIVNDSLEKELIRLSGQDWEKQPFVAPDPDALPELEPYGLDHLFRVTELNLRPSQPRIAPPPSGNAP